MLWETFESGYQRLKLSKKVIDTGQHRRTQVIHHLPQNPLLLGGRRGGDTHHRAGQGADGDGPFYESLGYARGNTQHVYAKRVTSH